jgi:hypothetical protein
MQAHGRVVVAVAVRMDGPVAMTDLAVEAAAAAEEI